MSNSEVVKQLGGTTYNYAAEIKGEHELRGLGGKSKLNLTQKLAITGIVGKSKLNFSEFTCNFSDLLAGSCNVCSSVHSNVTFQRSTQCSQLRS